MLYNRGGARISHLSHSHDKPRRRVRRTLSHEFKTLVASPAIRRVRRRADGDDTSIYCDSRQSRGSISEKCQRYLRHVPVTSGRWRKSANSSPMHRRRRHHRHRRRWVASSRAQRYKLHPVKRHVKRIIYWRRRRRHKTISIVMLL